MKENRFHQKGMSEKIVYSKEAEIQWIERASQENSLRIADLLSMAEKASMTEQTSIEDETQAGGTVTICGMVHSLRDMGSFTFLLLRRRDGLLQCTLDASVQGAEQLREGAAVTVTGCLRKEPRAPQGIELSLKSVDILSVPEETVPIPIAKKRLSCSLETKLDFRSITLRNLRERAIFKIQEGLVRGFRDYLHLREFTEIHTPKLGAKAAEGGSNIFRLDYFGKKAVLAQSPQFYKQTMVGVYDRVFEVAPVFRAEKHNTKRHLNEYTSMDFEMGFIRGFEDIMEMETGLLQYAMQLLEREYRKELDLLEVELPKTDRIPGVRFDVAKRLVAEKYHREIRNPYDLEPEEEQLIGQYFKEEQDADFVFVTHYPSKKRPFYTMDDPEDSRFTLSFDLLFRGVEITTGGQRIHDYAMLKEKLDKRGMSEEGMESYLSIFRYGMPPHGGLGIGLERLTMQLLREENVRETTLFPRDLNRLVP